MKFRQHIYVSESGGAEKQTDKQKKPNQTKQPIN